MTNQTNQTFNGIFSLNPEINSQIISDAIKARLSKSKALALVATSTDFETFNSDIVSDYLWAISDMLQEANCLHDILSNRVFNFDKQN